MFAHFQSLRVRHGSAIAAGLLSLLLTFLVVGCGNKGVQSIDEDHVSTKDTAFAFMLSSSSSDSGAFMHEDVGYLILVKEDGSATALDVGMMSSAQPLWNKDGLYLGTQHDELLINETGATRIPRSAPEHHELARYSFLDGHGFMTYYNCGQTNNDYLQRVVTSHGDVCTAHETWGIYPAMGQVGDELYAITDTCWLNPELKTAAQVHYEETGKREVEGTIPDTRGTLNVLVRIYPQPNEKVEIVAATKADERVSLATRELQLYQGKIYCPTFMRTDPLARLDEGKNPKEGIPILLVWDLTTGEKSYLPLTDNQGNPLPMVDDDSTLTRGQLNGSTYHFVTHNGRVYVADLETGIGRHLFDIPRPKADDYEFIDCDYAIHGAYVYVLNVKTSDKAHTPAQILRYKLDTGEEESICEIAGLYPYIKNYNGTVTTERLVINPQWLERHK